MTSEEAHALLNQLRDGRAAGASASQIRAALHITGDLDDDQPVRIFSPAGSWEVKREIGDARLPAGPFDGLAV